ncbi:MAG: hypothetical protein H6833_08035, partial [Planctomycetes bacterium]|nr:hypothetical protein [Planctomycetota bacterium]
VLALVAEHGLHADVTGWTRKTIDVYGPEEPRRFTRPLLVRVDSIATTTGEVLVFDDAGLTVATAIAELLERDYVREAVVCRRDPPNG